MVGLNAKHLEDGAWRGVTLRTDHAAYGNEGQRGEGRTTDDYRDYGVPRLIVGGLGGHRLTNATAIGMRANGGGRDSLRKAGLY
jgi:hypothetical protein